MLLGCRGRPDRARVGGSGLAGRRPALAASRRRVSQRAGSARRAARVCMLSLDGSPCSRAAPTTSGPRLARAPASDRSAPTTRARETSSSATSSASPRPPAIASLASKSTSQGWWRSSTTTLRPPRSWWAMRWACSTPTWRHSSTNNWSSSCSDASSARAAPGMYSITSRPAPLPVGQQATTANPHPSRAGQQDHVRLPLHLFGGEPKRPGSLAARLVSRRQAR